MLLSNFLRYIVTETLDQRQQHIKEYSIAVNALSRPSHFNPHDDAMVRIHAGGYENYLTNIILPTEKTILSSFMSQRAVMSQNLFITVK